MVGGPVGTTSQCLYFEADQALRCRLRPGGGGGIREHPARHRNSSEARRLFTVKDIYSYFAAGGEAGLQTPDLTASSEHRPRSVLPGRTRRPPDGESMQQRRGHHERANHGGGPGDRDGEWGGRQGDGTASSLSRVRSLPETAPCSLRAARPAQIDIRACAYEMAPGAPRDST